MIEIGLQELYNIISVVGFGFCMYKIRKLEAVIEIMKDNQLMSSIINFTLTKTLKDKGILDGNEVLEIENTKDKS
jgi:hypothetical protein